MLNLNISLKDKRERLIGT